MQNRFKTRFIAQESIAVQTARFYFEKPDGFEFKAGQFVDLSLDLLDLTEADRTHSFSLCSAPHEDTLAITTRLRDSVYKGALSRLVHDELVEIEGPYGKFIVPATVSNPIIILAGGVGITPALSIVRDATWHSSEQELFLFYSNRSESEAPFLAELALIAVENPRFHLVATMTADASWPGESTHISIEMIGRYADAANALFYISGPPGMVGAMREMLAQGGVARESIVFESFVGY